MRTTGVSGGMVWCVALGACGSGDGGFELRPGVVQIYAGAKADDYGCTEHDPAQCPNFEDIIVVDVDREEMCPPPAPTACGTRLAVLTKRGGAWDDNPLIHLSEDNGLTWRTLIPQANLYSNFAWDSFKLGVHLQNGEIYLLFTRSQDGAGGFSYSRLTARRVDPVTGAMGRDDPGWAYVGALAQRRPNGRLRWMVDGYDFRDGSRWPEYGEYDPATGAYTDSKSLTCTDGRVDGRPSLMGCMTSMFGSPNRGDYFDGYSLVDRDLCRYSYHVGDADGHSLCVPRRAWPGTRSSHIMPTLYVGTVPYGVWSDEGHARAAAIVAADSGAVTAVVELGAGGTPDYRLGRMQRPRWPRMVAIPPVTPGADRGVHDRLVDLGQGPDPVPTEVEFRDSPCSGDSCGYRGAPDYGYRLAQWIEPHSADAYLVFYVVQSEPNDNQQTLYVSVEKPTRRPIVAAPPPPFDPTNERPPADRPGLLPMSPIERACISLAGCGHIPAESVVACVNRWITSTPGVPALAAARAAFLAARTCEELAAFASPRPDMEHCGTGCMTAGGDCADGIDGSDNGGTDVPATCSLLHRGPEACGSCLGDGRFVRCGPYPADGPEHYAIPCADFGLVCAECPPWSSTGPACTPGCVPPGATCASAVPTCEGDVWTSCTPGSTGFQSYDCDVLGASCRAVTGEFRCAPTSGSTGSCGEGTPTDCLDQYRIVTCVADARYADCRALGFGGCEMVPQTVGNPTATAGKCW